MRQKGEFYREQGEPAYQAYHLATDKVMHQAVQQVAIPRRFSTVMREIWTLQNRFYNRGAKRVASLAAHPRFRAAYDFLVLRAEVGEADGELARWWTEFQKQNGGGQRDMTHEGGGGKRRRKRPRKRARRSSDGNG